MDLILAWAQCGAEVERLRAYRDVLDAQLGEGSVEEWLTEVTALSETVVRPAMGAEKRESLTRSRESVAHALHRAEGRLRSLRNDLWKRLDASPAPRKRLDAAVYWADRWESKQAGGEGA